jgi:hypothetical protein
MEEEEEEEPTVLELLREISGANEAYEIKEFLMFRPRKSDGNTREVRVTVLDAGPDHEPRWHVRIKDEDGRKARSNPDGSLRIARPCRRTGTSSTSKDLTEKRSGQSCPCLFRHPWQRVRVDRKRDGGRRVSEHLGDNLHRDPGREHQ